MADHSEFRGTSSSLPPGCRFHPSDQQLLCFYLYNKNVAISTLNPLETDAAPGFNLIKELDLFDYDPFDLPDFAGFSYGSRGSKKHWYYYTVSVLKHHRGQRRMKSGYWKRRGRVREVIDHGGIVLGMKRIFVFYLGDSLRSAVKTNWVMYEYALGDHLQASLVLHRVFVKSDRVNNSSVNGISVYGKESVSAVRHIGIQHDGFQATNIVDAKSREREKLNTTNDITGHPLIREPSYQLITEPVSATTLQVPSEDYISKMMTSSLITPCRSMSTDVIDSQQLNSILEGDFLEIDDLVD